jgi:hypothetical protein
VTICLSVRLLKNRTNSLSNPPVPDLVICVSFCCSEVPVACRHEGAMSDGC